MIAHCLDLADLVDSVGATYDAERHGGAFNAWGNSFPAEELPFGRRSVVGGVPYAMVDKVRYRPDNLEALGQRLPGGPPDARVEALALLAAGEMGSQELSVRVHVVGGMERRAVTVRGWLQRPEAPTGVDHLRCGHLHYPAGYELAHVVPGLWSHLVPLAGEPVTAVELLANPLVHIFAVTLLAEVGP